MMELTKGNITTIATWIAITITAIIGYFGYTVDQSQLLTVITGIITLIIAIWSSKNPNEITALGNGPVAETEEDVTGDCEDEE